MQHWVSRVPPNKPLQIAKAAGSGAFFAIVKQIRKDLEA